MIKWPYSLCSVGHRIMYEGPARLFNNGNIDVIDIGCGGGYGYTVMANENILHRYYGIDVDQASIDIHKNLLISKDHVAECVGWLESSPPFVADLVFCIEVIEHIVQTERKAFLEKCAKYTKRHMFLSSPKCGHTQIPHCGLMQPAQCSQMLRDAGFNVIIFDKQWTTLYVCEKT